MKLYRQGDVFIAVVAEIPIKARPVFHLSLAEGEVTGHAHCVVPRPGASAELFSLDSALFLRISGDGADVVHEDHDSIPLDAGLYRSWRQREYVVPARRANGLDYADVMD